MCLSSSARVTKHIIYICIIRLYAKHEMIISYLYKEQANTTNILLCTITYSIYLVSSRYVYRLYMPSLPRQVLTRVR